MPLRDVDYLDYFQKEGPERPLQRGPVAAPKVHLEDHEKLRTVALKRELNAVKS